MEETKIKAWHILGLVFLAFVIWQGIGPIFLDYIGIGDIVSDEPYHGTLSIQIIETNYFTGGTEATNSDSYTAYRGSVGPGVGGTAITVSGTDYNLLASDEGILYVEFDAGDGDFEVVDEIKRLNPETCVDVYWDDVDSDGIDDLIGMFDASDIGEVGQGLKPVLPITVPLIPEDVSGITTDNPADQTAIGNTETVVSVTWTVSGCTAQQGFVLGQLWFTFGNATYEGDDIKLEEVTLSGLNVDRTFPNPIYTLEGGNAGDYQGWCLKPADYTDWHNGIMCSRGTNKADMMTITANFRCTFETNDVETVTVRFTTVDSAGATASVTDAVQLKEA